MIIISSINPDDEEKIISECLRQDERLRNILFGVTKLVKLNPKTIIKWVIPKQKMKWENTKNPLFIFHTFKICRKNDIQIPEWILEYFEESADRLLSTESDKNKKAASQVYDALGMNKPGRMNTFSEYITYKEKEDIFLLVEE